MLCENSLWEGLESPISDTFPATNQFCWHFAVPSRALTAVLHLAQKSTKVYKSLQTTKVYKLQKGTFSATVGTRSITGDALHNFEGHAGVECFPSDKSYPLQFKYISFEAVRIASTSSASMDEH